MATKKVTRSKNPGTLLPAPPTSERRIKAAAATPLPPDVAAAHRNLSRQSSHEIIDAIRRQIAEMWWYGDRTLKAPNGAGVSNDDARDAMADLVCQIGIDLNQLGDEIDELAKRGEP